MSTTKTVQVEDNIDIEAVLTEISRALNSAKSAASRSVICAEDAHCTCQTEYAQLVLVKIQAWETVSRMEMQRAESLARIVVLLSQGDKTDD